MSSVVYKQAQGIWKGIATLSVVERNKIEADARKKILHLFQVGDYYYYVFNLHKMEFEFISAEVKSVLGYTTSQLNVPFFLSQVHPEDIQWFMDFEQMVVSFFNNIGPHRANKYKVRYDYRIKKADGTYIRILHQMLNIEPDHQGIAARTLCLHTDITYLKKEGRPVLSFIGMEGEPSYIDVAVDAKRMSVGENLSRREKEILTLLMQGESSKEIASRLFISKLTVDTHRRNMLKKAGFQSTTELATNAIKEGWL